MIEVLWEFVVPEKSKDEFERHYSPGGTWTQFFRRSAAYHGTTLLAGEGNRYLTCVRCDSREAYEDFRWAIGEDFAALECRFEPLTLAEDSLGIFEMK